MESRREQTFVQVLCILFNNFLFVKFFCMPDFVQLQDPKLYFLLACFGIAMLVVEGALGVAAIHGKKVGTGGA